ncbi:S41 family peptidase [Pedobacter sp. SYSU D00535]|uniref:S41 family peptidase n=1 Tax=Pedobacter sp. SYSU D00535 TaxID=2810308 RepID=UPI001A9578F7|nr:S41 family peptidase [Pedobacter sp. SYSU D00535]
MKTHISIACKRVFFYSILLLTVLSGCKDESDVEPEPEPPVITPAGTRTELIKDSIFLYAKQVYLWNESLPSYQEFNPRRYNTFPDEISNYHKELYDITQYKINPATGRPYEYISPTADYPKYSYITDNTSDNPPRTTQAPLISEVTLEGVGTDFGIALSAVGTTSSYQVYIRYVNQGSPADKAFLARGDLLTEINGRTLGGNFSSDQNYINNAFDQSSIRLAGRKPNGSTFIRTLTKMTYTSSPVFKDTVVERSGKKVGYIAFARFSNPSNATEPLNRSFARFASRGITDLVVDLRYNGGGYVSTAEHMSNLIAPSSVNGNVMFTEYFNETMRSGQATILRNQPLLNASGNPQYSNGKLVTYFDIDYSVAENTYRFQKKGNLNGINNVVFIITGNTASASELVINVLKPYMNVKLVGSTSYGKPVGFFPITIDRYDVYYSMFESRNSRGEGGYYEGFAPDSQAADDVTRDFGDPQEASFATALNYILTGSLVASAPPVKLLGKSVSVASVPIKPLGTDNSFKGMIELPRRLKLK